MLSFSDLETAALKAIFDEIPEIGVWLRQQFKVATVLERENTGGGFITTIGVPDGVPHVSGPWVLGSETEACIDGLAHGLGFALLLKDGKLHVLDGYSQGGENTAGLDFDRVGFSVGKMTLKE